MGVKNKPLHFATSGFIWHAGKPLIQMTGVPTWIHLIARSYGRSHGVGLKDALVAATEQEHGFKFCTLNIKYNSALVNHQLKQALTKT